MRTRIHHQAWIIATALVVFFTNLGGPRLWDDDEPKNATCAREMFERGDWIVPTFNAELRTDKPVLVYWLMMGSYALFGATEFAARFPSAALAVGTALATYHLGRLLFRPQAGLWAGLIMATNLMFTIVARAATPDSTLIFFTTVALLIYVWSVGGGREGGFLTGWRSIRSGDFRAALPRSWKGMAAMYAAMSLAVLAKGPVGLLLPCAGIGLFLLLVCVRTRIRVAPPEHATLLNLSVYRCRTALARLREYAARSPSALLAMQPQLLVATMMAIAGPWYVLVGIKTGGAWPRGFFLTHNFERFIQPIGGHRGTIFFHVVALAVCFFPWTLLLPAGAAQFVRRVRASEPRSAAYLLAGSWSGAWFAVFSLAGTKLPSYVLPAYPALAVICGVWVADWVAAPGRRSTHRWLSAGWAALALAGVGLTVGIWLAVSRLFPGEVNFAWIGLIPIVGAGLGWYFQRRMRPARSFGSLVVTAVTLFVALFAVAAVPISRRQVGAQFAETLRQFGDKPDQIGMIHVGTAGLIFYAGQQVQDVKQDRDGVQSFFARTERPLLVTDAEGYEALRPLLPPDATIVERQSGFLKRGEMIVIGREPAAELAAKGRSSRASDAAPLEEARRAERPTTHDALRR